MRSALTRAGVQALWLVMSQLSTEPGATLVEAELTIWGVVGFVPLVVKAKPRSWW